MTEPQTDRLIQAVDNLAAAQTAHMPLMDGLIATGIYSLVGAVLAIVAYKIFDLVTPGDLHKEIVENKNIAAAIVGGAVVIGVSIVVAAAIMG